ncbi:DNA gyrase subunit A [Longimicrobium sp.]|uniref:DNA gyrase subunit A n=1 Tax=Longimicrobium sp. TaxID=2029185 RepID=UPI002B52840A|nr:DNA gyrase subunit A [Longimicrobium sp.]HSU15398.1 DNA gyrase subunit A [Longimicrobium sp.]
MIATTQRERVLPRLIEDEMRESFIDYSMSVIVQRALPDVRDGLKPVHRRILFAMYEAGLTPARPYKKSATVVGDVLGKYHPHGDTAVYDSLVRMAQEFALRYPLVDGQGNFGSIDGDNAAAYRYTEAKLSAVAMELLADIDRDTVDFAPNFDDRLQEPRVLPARVPNLLVNGSSGIAVGMSTNIPPHNLGEVVAAALHLLDHPDCEVDDLMAHLPGPDFPTGGIIVGTAGIRDAYTKGRGRVVMRARVYKESRRNGREQLVVTEIPYGTNKSRIIEQIAELTRAGRMSDVSDLRDESDRDGIRMVLELKRGADAVKVLNQIYKWTALQSTFGVIALALDHGVPRELGLKPILERWRDHRVQVVVRRSRWELERSRDEAHVLRGLMVALSRIDDVVRIIRSSRTRETAAAKLEKELKLDERQSKAILEMRLSRLTQLESRELRDRLDELERRIVELEAILASSERQTDLIRGELRDLAEKYADPRRTKIYENEKSVKLEDMLAAEHVVVTVSREGYVRQIPMAVYQRSMTAGKRIALDRYEDDYVERAFVASTDDTLLVFSTDGRAFGITVRDIPEAGITARGKALGQIFELGKKAGVAAVHVVSEFRADRSVLFATADGTVKRTALDQYANARVGGIEAIKLTGKDQLADVRVTDGEGEVILVGRGGRAIRFAESEVPMMGRAAQGVRGMKLKEGESVVGFVVARREGGELCLVTERGWAKRVPLDELVPQGRGGLGTPLLATSRETGEVAAAREVHPGEDLMATTSGGRAVRVKPEAAPQSGRAGAAEKSVGITGSERIAAVTHVAERELPESPEDDEPIALAPAVEDEGMEIEDAPSPPPSSDGASPPAAAEEPEPPADGELDLFA